MQSLKILDLRPHTAKSEAKIIDYLDDKVLFLSEDQPMGDHVLYEYDVATESLTERHRYPMPKEAFLDSFTYTSRHKVLIVKTHETGAVHVDICDTHDHTMQQYTIPIDGEVLSIPIGLDERYFFAFVDKDDEDDLYLFDVVKQSAHKVVDKRVIHSMSYFYGNQCIPSFINKGEAYLCLNETTMCDYERLDIHNMIQRGEIKARDVFEPMEALHIVLKHELINSIKEGKDVSLTTLATSSISGWVRYLGMDEDFIYYREMRFEDRTERILAFDLLDMDVVEVTAIDHKCLKGELRYHDPYIYEIMEDDDALKVMGRFGMEGEIVCHRPQGRFHDFVGERYLITSWWTEDAEGENYKEFTQLTDIVDNTKDTYEGYYEVYGSTMILYNT